MKTNSRNQKMELIKGLVNGEINPKTVNPKTLKPKDLKVEKMTTPELKMLIAVGRKQEKNEQLTSDDEVFLHDVMERYYE